MKKKNNRFSIREIFEKARKQRRRRKKMKQVRTGAEELLKTVLEAYMEANAESARGQKHEEVNPDFDPDEIIHQMNQEFNMKDQQPRIEENRFFEKMRQAAGKIPFAREAAAMFYCLKDPLTPWAPKVSIASALAYFIFPADAIPDVLAPVGYGDDAAVIFATLRIVYDFITDEHWAKADQFLRITGEPGQDDVITP